LKGILYAQRLGTADAIGLGHADPSIPAMTQENPMTQKHPSISVWRTRAIKHAAASALAACWAAWAAPSAAQAVGADLRMAELEKAFWVCDHAATTSGVDRHTAVTCVALTDTLKQRKFNGDFDAMLAWWEQHKEAEHLALAAVGRKALARLAPADRR
jgi:hypothetical protein